MHVDGTELAEETARIFERARGIAKHYSEVYAYFWIGTGHVLSAMVCDQERNTAKDFLVRKGVDPDDILDEVGQRVEEGAMSGFKEDQSVKTADDGRFSDTLRNAIRFAAMEGRPVTAGALLRAFLARNGSFCDAARILADGTSSIDDALFETLRT